MPTKNQTERIRQRLEELKELKKAAAKPAAAEEVTESDAAAVRPAVTAKPDVGGEFTIDGALKFTWLLDGTKLAGQYRLNNDTITVNDPVVGYTYSMPITLLFMQTRGIGRLVDLEKPAINMSNKFRLRSGEFIANMAFPFALPRVAWRVANRKIVWAIVQFQPTKSEWRIARLRSTPIQTLYEASEILRTIIGDNAFSRLKEAIELIATPL